jgi:hypothetical protein
MRPGAACRVWPSRQHKCDPYGPRGTLGLTCLVYTTCGRELLRGRRQPIRLTVPFMILTSSVRNILDTTPYKHEKQIFVICENGYRVEQKIVTVAFELTSDRTMKTFLCYMHRYRYKAGVKQVINYQFIQPNLHTPKYTHTKTSANLLLHAPDTSRGLWTFFCFN